MASPRLVKVSVAAELLSVSDETVYRLARRRRISYFRDPETGHWLFSAASIERYLTANTVEAQPIADQTDLPRQQRRRRRSATPAAASSGGDPPWKGFLWRDDAGQTARPTRRRQTARGGAAGPS